MTYSRKGMLEATALRLACCQIRSGTRATCTAWVSSLAVSLGDHERWFHVETRQKFEFDEAASEELAQRVPLPAELAQQLTFDLARWKPTTT